MTNNAPDHSRIACLGECMVELHGTGPQTYRQTFGGDTFNTAAYIARLGQWFGIRADYLTGLGTDPFSTAMLGFFRELGVGTNHIRRLEERMPGLYLIEVDRHGERTFHYWRGEAAARFCLDLNTPEALASELSAFGHIYLSGISLAILTSNGRDVLFAALEQCKKDGARICFDSNYRPNLWPNKEAAQKEFIKILQLSDTAILTADDMLDLFDLEDNQATLALCREHGVEEVVLKRGADPCIIHVDGQFFEVPSKSGVNVVDTTAAGDSFNAAYLTARILGNNPDFSARCGHELAAAVIQHHGAIIAADHMPKNLLHADPVPAGCQEGTSCARK
ncbi:MAG: sugar kinase [Desulfovibrio sp.]|uniref:sugar kinase n=1 Tax=Desulfovibrio sp. 7SRBS1 TaxID=3378064 RepID=UPI003B3FB0C2